MPGLPAAVAWAGVIMVFHAAFSAVHYKELSTLAGIELAAEELIPFDVVVETLLGVVIATFGAMMNAGKMLPIDGSVLYNKVRYESWWDSPNFRIYNHRAKWLKQRLES